jgi:hypothetical protein
MRRRMSWVGVVVVLGCLCAPAGALAGNEGAPWSAPTWLDPGDNGGASGISLSELASGALVATWNQYIEGSAYPDMASEPFDGGWSAPYSLSGTAMTDPQDQLGGVRTATAAGGKFVSVWQTPAPADQADSGASENDIVGVSGTVTPGDQPAFTTHTWGLGYSQDIAPRGSSYQYPYTPMVAMSSDGTGSVEFTAAGSNADGETTDKQLVAIENGSPDSLSPWQPPIYDNTPDGSGDYDKYIPQLGVAPLDADWTASTNDTEAMLATSNNYPTQYNGVTAPGQNALLDTTSDPLDWYSLNPIVLPMLGELATPSVLPDGNVMVVNDADDLGASDTWGTGNYGIEVWETGDSTAKVLDDDTEEPAGYPAVATFNNGSVTVAYIDDNLSDGASVKEVTMSPGGQWSDPVTLFTAPENAQILDVTDAYGPDGTTYVAWDVLDTSTPADEGLDASVRLPGGSFPTTPDTVYAHAASDPKIAVDQTGYATIVAEAFDPGVGYQVAAFTRANPIPPELITKPAISIVGGKASVGAELVCAGDSWRNRPTSFQVKWLRGTSPISGATARTYKATSADQGQSVSCEVIATNAYGSGLGQSAGVKIGAASGSASPSTGSVGTVNGNTVTFTASCPAAATSCTVLIAQLTVIEELQGNKVVAVIARAKRRKKTIVIGQTKVSLKPGQKRKVVVKLNGTGAKLLKKHPKLKVLFTVKAGSKKLTSKTLSLSEKKKKRRR